jgi:predicted N-acetyltransferase YhbS
MALLIREATEADQPAVLALLAQAMQRPPDDRFAELLAWKHERSAFGPSYAWVAEDDGAVVGYRALLRWEFADGSGNPIHAARAVDTATDPRQQGKGIFRSLTMHAIDELRSRDVDFIFNTPNDQSRPGYLKMGWQPVGTLRPWIRPASLRHLPSIARSRVPASHFGERTTAGRPAAEVFSDDTATAALLASSTIADGRLRTHRTPAYLRWRYDEPLLGYRVAAISADLAEGVACYRLRQRGSVIEATIGDLLAPGQDRATRRRLVGEVLRSTGADYALVLGGGIAEAMLPLPGQGPTLVHRTVASEQPRPLDSWGLTMGDIELF